MENKQIVKIMWIAKALVFQIPCFFGNDVTRLVTLIAEKPQTNSSIQFEYSKPDSRDIRRCLKTIQCVDCAQNLNYRVFRKFLLKLRPRKQKT